MAVFLNDDYEHFFVRNSLEDMTQAALERQVDLYHQAGVSTCFFCVNAQSAYYESCQEPRRHFERLRHSAGISRRRCLRQFGQNRVLCCH